VADLDSVEVGGGRVLDSFAGVGEERLAEFGTLSMVVEGFDGLLETDGDNEADNDGSDVDEEVAPGVNGFVGCVDV
jgi:hypothetical protein